MQTYHPAERRIALIAMERLSENCPCRLLPWEPEMPPTSHRSHCPFRHGSAMEVSHDGRVSYALSPYGSVDYESGYYEKRQAGRLVDLDPPLGRISPETLALAVSQGHRPTAPPQAGFRVQPRGHDTVGDLVFHVPSDDPSGYDSAPVAVDFSRKQPSLHMGPADAHIDSLEYLADKMGEEVWAAEDAMCLERLDALEGEEEFCYGGQSTLNDLARFVRELNSGRPRKFHFDTVFMDHETHLRLFSADARTSGGVSALHPYENMIRLWGITFLRPDGMLSTSSFVTSSRQGPIFANGPHTTRCTEDGLDVTHHCALVDPPEPRVQGMPWGVRVRPVCR